MHKVRAACFNTSNSLSLLVGSLPVTCPPTGSMLMVVSQIKVKQYLQYAVCERVTQGRKYLSNKKGSNPSLVRAWPSLTWPSLAIHWTCRFSQISGFGA